MGKNKFTKITLFLLKVIVPSMERWKKRRHLIKSKYSGIYASYFDILWRLHWANWISYLLFVFEFGERALVWAHQVHAHRSSFGIFSFFWREITAIKSCNRGRNCIMQNAARLLLALRMTFVNLSFVLSFILCAHYLWMNEWNGIHIMCLHFHHVQCNVIKCGWSAWR